MKLVSAESVGMNADSLSRIGVHMRERYIKPGKIAGTSTLIARRGKVCYWEQEGLMDRERKVSMAPDSIFRIYSMTKPITTVALMMLFEEGRFSLTDTVARYIPEFKDLRVWKAGSYPYFDTSPCERPMQVRDLLMHTAGLTYEFMQQDNVDAAYRKLQISNPREDYTLKEMIENLAKLPLVFSPGNRWNYSVATDVAGYLVEVLSGQSLASFMQERIFTPLGMNDTSFELDESKSHRLAACYERALDKSVNLQDDPLDSAYKNRSFYSGGGGLLSTMSDYYRFCQMLLGGGVLDGVRLLGPRTLDFMCRNHLPGGADLAELASGSFSETVNEGVGFGLGFAVKDNPLRNGCTGSQGQYFWGGMASTIFWVDPVEELIVIFMTQLIPSGTYDFRGQLDSIIYGAIEP